MFGRLWIRLFRKHRIKYEIFGARAHDPSFWQDHPLVVQSEAHFDGEFGWIELATEGVRPIDRLPVRATYVEWDATQEGPDLYFWGEGDCPVALFEHAPRLEELRVAIRGPIPDDSRTCWSVGLWLAERSAEPRTAKG